MTASPSPKPCTTQAATSAHAGPSSSPWRIPLVREIAVIALIKLAVLLAIKALWFPSPTLPVDGSERVSQHLLTDTPQPPVSSRPAVSKEYRNDLGTTR